jgi:hypothetical protein
MPVLAAIWRVIAAEVTLTAGAGGAGGAVGGAGVVTGAGAGWDATGAFALPPSLPPPQPASTTPAVAQISPFFIFLFQIIV